MGQAIARAFQAYCAFGIATFGLLLRAAPITTIAIATVLCVMPLFTLGQIDQEMVQDRADRAALRESVKQEIAGLRDQIAGARDQISALTARIEQIESRSQRRDTRWWKR